MALAAYVDSLEALPEALRPFYVPTEDGRFRLDAEGGADVSGLEWALGKERAATEALKAELKAKAKRVWATRWWKATACSSVWHVASCWIC